jgi:hypothetical protein
LGKRIIWENRASTQGVSCTERQNFATRSPTGRNWKRALAMKRGGVMSGRRSLIKGYFWRCAGRGCGHVFGLSRGQLDPLALMLSADPLPRSEQRA